MADKQIIMEDCVYFIGGNCQEYLDGVCENHKCDLKIIRELEQKLKAKEQECEELKEQLKEMNEVIRTETTRCSLVNILKIELDQLKAELTRANCQIADDEILQCDMREAIEELKAENDELKSLLKVRIEDLCDSCGASSMMPMPCKVYEKTLTEIKEIAELKQKQSVFVGETVFEQILQKISEVLE